MSTTALTTGSTLPAETKKALRLLGDTIAQMESEALSLDELSRCNAHQDPFENAAKAYSRQIEAQLKYYRERWLLSYGDNEFGSIYVPRPKGYLKTILVLPSYFAGPEDVFSKWKSEAKFKVWKWDESKSLNHLIPNDRRRLGHYALLHGGRQEADVELQNRSWEDNFRDRVEMMRATEALLFEDQHYTEHKKHIDPEATATLTGSLDVDGDAVVVYWRPDNEKFYVYGYDLQDAGPDLRSRAVSL